MWILVLIIFSPVGDVDRVVAIEKYETSVECKDERDRVSLEMRKSYPNDNTFIMECRFDGKKV